MMERESGQNLGSRPQCNPIWLTHQYYSHSILAIVMGGVCMGGGYMGVRECAFDPTRVCMYSPIYLEERLFIIAQRRLRQVRLATDL